MSRPPRSGDEDIGRTERRRELAREIVRRQLELTEAERALIGLDLGRVLKLGKRSGLSAAELQRGSGHSRAAVYKALADRAEVDMVDELELLASVAASGPVQADQLASDLGAPIVELERILGTLVARQLVTPLIGRYLDPTTEETAYTLGPSGEQVLLAATLDLERRPQSGAWSIYLTVEESERRRIEGATRRVCGSQNATVMGAEVSSAMLGPELGLAVRAPTQRAALETAASVWADIRRAARLRPNLPRVTLMLPPA